MTRDNFRENIVNIVTENGSLPIAPKNDTIDTIINNAKRYFYENWVYGQEEQYLIIKRDVLSSPLFKAKRQIKLPDTVRYVHQFEECKSNFFYNDINPDFRKTNFNYTAYAVNADSDTMLTAVTYAYYMDFIKQFVLKTVAFTYSSQSHMLFIVGRDQTLSHDLGARVMVDLPEEDLFNSDLFIRYVAAQCRLSANRAFSIIKMKTLGGGSIDWSEIKADAKADLADIKEIMDDDDSGAAFFMMDGQMIG